MPTVKRKLIGFGDSWTQGSELNTDEQSYVQLLAERLGCAEYVNYGQPGSSINHLLVQLQRHLIKLSATHQDPAEWTAVFFLTDKNRGATVYQDRWIFQNVTGGHGEQNADPQYLDQVNQVYWRYIHSPELCDLTVNATILALQSVCQHHGIADYYIAGWQSFDFWPEVDLTKIYQSGQVNCGNLIGMQLEMPHAHANRQNPNQAPGGHPNQQGHRLIADALYDWIAHA